MSVGPRSVAAVVVGEGNVASRTAAIVHPCLLKRIEDGERARRSVRAR